jgi:hypothetical protein
MTRRKKATREMLGLTRAEFATLRRLRTPQRSRQFLYRLKQNFERKGETCHSVRVVLRDRRAHCIEGADHRRLRAVDPRRAAAAARFPGGARFRPRRRGVPAQRPLGRDFQDQRHRPALARPGVPVPARTGDVLPARVLQQARPQDAAHLVGPYDLRAHEAEDWVTAEDGAWDLVDESRRAALQIDEPGAVRAADPPGSLEREAGKIHCKYKRPKKR